jgi:hypothetical protein
MLSAQNQASAWRIRRANRSKIYISKLPIWAAGLVIAAGQYVQSDGLAWRALNDGTTAGTAPNNSSGASFTDGGGVAFEHVALLLAAQPTI